MPGEWVPDLAARFLVLYIDHMRRVAIVGIDGSGKSALVQRLRQYPVAPDRLAAFNCPRFHDTPGAPLAELSSRLKAFSDVADDLGSFELKLAALYLRMTLYGPVEHFFLDTFAPRLLVSERHPLVDTLVYVPLYRSRAATAVDAAAVEPVLRARLDEESPGAYAAARTWHELENRRLGRETGFWALAQDIVAGFAAPPEDVLADFGARYRTTLPDTVVLLEADVAEASRRLRGRGSRRPELHEDEQALAVLRDTYDLVLDQLSRLRPEMEVRRIANSGRSIDDTVEELLVTLGVPAESHRAESMSCSPSRRMSRFTM
jgi:hypothetical protein